MTTENLRKKIAAAWEHRWHRDLEKSTLSFYELKRDLGFPSRLERAQGWPGKDFKISDEVVQELFAMEISMSRVQERWMEAEHGVEAAIDFLRRRGAYAPPAILFERGLNYLNRGDYVGAMEDFLAVSSAGESDFNPMRHFASKANAIFCMKNLGLPFLGLLQELESAKKLPESVDVALRTFKLREGIRQGAELRDCRRDASGQEIYLTAWASSLPYYPLRLETLETRVQAYLMDASRQYCPSYRSRTLQGILNPEDFNVIRPSEFVDRFYLWVWKWLTDPEAMPITKILSLLAEGAVLSKTELFTKEDVVLFSNALRWIGLFDVNGKEVVERALAKVPMVASDSFPVLQLERLVIGAFEAKLEKREDLFNDCLLQMKAHRLWEASHIGFRQMVQDLGGPRPPGSRTKSVGPRLSQVIGRLNELLNGPNQQSLAKIVVDLEQGRVINRNRSRTIASDAMVAALKLMSDRQVVSSEEFALHVFGIRRFDLTVHQAKIFNLLARIRDFVSSEASCIEFKTKSGRIMALGEWSEIEFVLPRKTRIQLSRERDWQKFLGSSSEGPELDPRKLFRNSKAFTRRELELKLMRPRSTTNRILSKWVNDGLVRRTGKSRTSRYAVETDDKSEVS